MRLLLFNPENDLALASGDAHYTPPASALAMARDMQDFPLLWATADDVILRRDGVVIDTKGQYVASALTDVADAITSVQPWGWSPLLARQLRDMGLPDRLLPSETQMDAYRAWSSRQTAVKLLTRLREEWPDAFLADGALVGESEWCVSEEEVATAKNRYGSCMLKAPWSGSGRGVRPVKATLMSPKDIAWVQSVLQRQGGVEVEPLYDRRLDFAMEFWAEGGRVCYEGLSLFETTVGGVYQGNLVASEPEKEVLMAQYMAPDLLHLLKERFERLLSAAHLPVWYTGPVGVDMMVVGGSRPKIHPLVEVNLRATMGWVALQLARSLPAGCRRRFRMNNHDGHYGYSLE